MRFKSEMTKQAEEFKDMMKFIDTDSYENKFLEPKLTDPTSALILV